MNNTGKVQISWIEAISILTVSQIFLTVAFSLNSQNGLNAFSCMIAFLLGTVLNFIIILPFVFLNKRFGTVSLLDCCYRIIGKFAFIVAIILFIIFTSVVVMSITTFEEFLSASVINNSSFLIILLLTLTASYGAFLGIEALGRFANVVFVLVSISILAVLFSVVENIELINFGGLDFADAKAVFKTAVQGVLSNTGLLSAVILTPIVTKKHFRGFVFWNLFSLIIVEIIAFSVTGVLGDYALTKEYPYFSTATVAEFSVLKRLDIVYMCTWILVAFVKTTFYLLLSKNVLDTILHEKAKRYSLSFTSGVVLVLSYIASARPIVKDVINSFISSGFVLVGIVVIVPILLLIVSLVRGRENYEKS